MSPEAVQKPGQYSGFATFAGGKPDNVRLVLHEAVAFSTEREELMQLAVQLGVAERLAMSTGGESGASNEELNLLYSACDVGVNTAMGEGWGLVRFDALSRHTIEAR